MVSSGIKSQANDNLLLMKGKKDNEEKTCGKMLK